MSTVNIGISVREENRRRAAELSQRFQAQNLRVIGILGSPGSGKTTLLENILPAMMAKKRVGVIEGDIATDNDSRRVAAAGARAFQINTDGACHLDSAMVARALESMRTDDLDVLFIENVGNLVCPVGYPLGETVRAAVISAAEGEDKPLKYPEAILKTDALVITKTDLCPYVHVDAAKMAANARAVNPRVCVFFTRFTGDPSHPYEAADENGTSLADWFLG